MNYVNREAAQALKDAGFDVPCVYRYFHKSENIEVVIPDQPTETPY
jgi:hypothetical protein